MATNLTISSSSYAGELALPYISAAVLSGDTLANNYVTVKENVKYKIVLKTLASTGIVKAWGCDFDSSGAALTLAERVLTVTDLKVNIEVCKDQFAKDWEGLQTGRGFANDTIPSNFADFLIAHLSGKVAENIEYTLWQGNFESSSYTSFNGILKVLDTAKGGTPEVDYASAFTAGNIIASLQSLCDALPATLIGDSLVKLYINRKSAQFYKQALAALGYLQTFNGTANFPLTFNGYDIYVCPGIPDNVALLANPENLVFGTDLTSDFNECKVVDMSVTDGSDNVRMVMKFRAGTQVAIPSDAILGFMNP